MNATDQRGCVRLVDDGGLKVHGSEHPAGCCFATLKLVDEDPEDEQGHRHPRGNEEEGHQFPRRDFAALGQTATCDREQTERNASNGVDAGEEPVTLLACTDGLITVFPGLTLNTIGFPGLRVVGLHHRDARNKVLEHRRDAARGLTLFPVPSLDPRGKPVHERDDEHQRTEDDRGQFPRHRQKDQESEPEGHHDADDRRGGIGHDVLQLVDVRREHGHDLSGLPQIVIRGFHGDEGTRGLHPQIVLNFVSQSLPRVLGDALEDGKHHEGRENDEAVTDSGLAEEGDKVAHWTHACNRT